ncbi:glycoside hydrolase family 35 protein [Nitrospirillum iridis]|uniref:Beta-galactosidase n=1 Tax=Nitrospirillum iridis TaxID=765888 RepID=A0A7X0AW17_9PROT|nr:beta-galactosidase [Nitrospirillum iridis]MBB6251164.1 beta-galactosidase [Nitrospirillum iridis]
MIPRRTFMAGAAGLALGAALPASAARAAGGRFTVQGDQFLLDGQPLWLLAGELHYPRIARADWRDRLRKLKSLGLNTLSTYVFWNAHEKAPGHYDFTGNLDLAAWVSLAQEEGLHVFLRAGPYACAEWDGGALPAWVFPDETVKARTLDPTYMSLSGRWLKRLGQEVAHLEVDKGGPILMTQVENEYGSFGQDRAYMEAVRDQIRAAGFDGPLYTVDGASVIEKGALPSLINGINFGTTDKAEEEFKRYAAFKPTGPRICTELWGGWFDHFGEVHSSMPVPPLLDSLKWMLDNHISISFYMAHGGTSFGFDAGANFDRKTQTYQPDISSYDYDALLDEAGRPTPKYDAVLDLLKRYLPPERFAPLPEPRKALEVPRFRLTETAAPTPLWGKAVEASAPRTLESLGQSHGLMRYRHRFAKAAKGTLRVGEVRDYAVVSVNGRRVGVFDRRLKQREIDISAQAGDWLEVLVDTMGHVNYGERIGMDQKGLMGGVTLDGQPVTGWSHQGLPLDDLTGLTFQAGAGDGPAFHRGTFEVTEAGYTFLDMRGWGKGYAWVNGHNLGRHWSVGPQRSLFVPESFLKIGTNEVVVFDLHPATEGSMAGGRAQIWDLPGQVKE